MLLVLCLNSRETLPVVCLSPLEALRNVGLRLSHYLGQPSLVLRQLLILILAGEGCLVEVRQLTYKIGRSHGTHGSK